MILKNEYDLLVLAGAWNKAIFNEKWISKQLLTGVESLKVEQFVNHLELSSRVSSKDIRIHSLSNRLSFIPISTTDNTLNLIEELSSKIADYLPHTPVNSFGVNFLFEEEINDSLKKIITVNDVEPLSEFGVLLKETQHKHCIEHESKKINLTISTIKSKVIFNFNFDFNISSLIEFKEKITTNPILALKNTAIKIMSEVYSLESDSISQVT